MRVISLLFAAAVSAIAGTAVAQPPPLLAQIQADPELTTFAALIETSGLEARLAEEGPWTVFAPTDAAFAAMPKAERTELGTTTGASAFVEKHLARGHYEAKSAMGRPLDIVMVSGGSKPLAAVFVGCGALDASLGTSTIAITDIRAANGVLHLLAEPLD